MFGRKKEEVCRLKRELVAEMKGRLSALRELDAARKELAQTLEELEKYREKASAIDQFYNLVTFDGKRQEEVNG